MGANKLNLNLDRAKRVKKFMSEANSELLLLFLKVMQVLTKKLPQRTERKRSSIEFERSENQGQFFIQWAFNYF